MAKQWFSAAPKPTDDIRLNKGNITITEAGLGKLHGIDSAFAEATSVRLAWDGEHNAIAIAPANNGDQATFKLGKRGRSLTTRTINATPFYERFGIAMPDESASTSSIFTDHDGEAAFKLPANGTDGTAKKRRGRRKKSEIEAAQ